jgi:hypothetical protein
MVITETGAGSAVATLPFRRKTDLKCDSRTCTKWFFGCFEFRSLKNNFGSEINAIMKNTL